MLMKEYPKIEWLAYLIGDKDDPYVVEDIHVPTQKVTSVTVSGIECPEFNQIGCIGVIHSHHGMGNGFSGTDHEWLNQNHNLSLCISKGGISGQVRHKTECGGLVIVPVGDVDVLYNIFFDKEDFIKIANEKIKKNKNDDEDVFGRFVDEPSSIGVPLPVERKKGEKCTIKIGVFGEDFGLYGKCNVCKDRKDCNELSDLYDKEGEEEREEEREEIFDEYDDFIFFEEDEEYDETDEDDNFYFNSVEETV